VNFYEKRNWKSLVCPLLFGTLRTQAALVVIHYHTGQVVICAAAGLLKQSDAGGLTPGCTCCPGRRWSNS